MPDGRYRISPVEESRARREIAERYSEAHHRHVAGVLDGYVLASLSLPCPSCDVIMSGIVAAPAGCKVFRGVTCGNCQHSFTVEFSETPPTVDA